MKHFESQKQFFGDFEDMDLEIKCQVKAILNKDYETLAKLKRDEMSKMDIQIYLADKFTQRELMEEEQADLNKDSEHSADSELNNNEFFNEFWVSDLAGVQMPRIAGKRAMSVAPGLDSVTGKSMGG